MPTGTETDVVKAIHLKGDNSDLIVSANRLDYIRYEDETLDATYGKGVFWKQWQPMYLVPNDWDPDKGYHHYDFRELPTSWQERFDVVVFDPDYKLQGTSSNNGPASSNARYGMDRPYRPVASTMDLYLDGMRECHRVLKPGGFLMVKTMDQVVSGSKYWLTREIINFGCGVPWTRWLQTGNSRLDETINAEIADELRGLGCKLEDLFMLEGMRAQPSNRTRKCPACKGTGVTDGHYEVDPHRFIGDECTSCEGSGRVPTVQQHSATNYSTLLIFRKRTT